MKLVCNDEEEKEAKEEAKEAAKKAAENLAESMAEAGEALDDMVGALDKIGDDESIPS